MFIGVFALLPVLSSGCHPIFELREGGLCYSEQRCNSWDECEATCAERDAHVAIIRTAEENANIASTLHEDGLFIGLLCQNDSVSWEDSTPYKYHNFSTAPVCDERYFFGVFKDGRWDRVRVSGSALCQSNKPSASACDYYDEVGGTNGSVSGCALSQRYQRGWKEAAKTCADQDGSLAAIHDKETNDYFQTIVKENYFDGIHIGLSLDEDGNYTWTDGSPLNYSNFAPGFPKPQFGSCVSMQVGGAWYNTDCAQNLNYACTRPVFVLGETQPAGCPNKTFEVGDEIFSPSYPAPSGPGECVYFIYAPKPDDKIRLTVNVFETNSCCDSLTVFGTSRELRGIERPGTVIDTLSSKLRLVWNAKSGANTKGFKLTVSLVPKDERSL